MNSPWTGSSRPFRVAKVLLQLLLTGAVTWFILRAVGFRMEELQAFDLSALEVGWGLVALSSGVLLAAYLYSAALWGLMVRAIGGPEVGLLASLRVFFTANLGRYLPGKIWQVAGLAYLARGEGVPAGTATAAAVLGQAFSLAGATLLGAGVLLGGETGPSLGSGWIGLGVVALLLVAGSPSIFRILLPLWFRLARQEAPGGFRPDHAFGVRWMGLYLLGWGVQGLAFWILALGCGFRMTAMEAVPAYAAAYLVGYVALFAPAGAGVREGILVGLLGPVLGAGAAVLALLARLWTTIMELLPALILGSKYLTRSMREGNQSV